MPHIAMSGGERREPKVVQEERGKKLVRGCSERRTTKDKNERVSKPSTEGTTLGEDQQNLETGHQKWENKIKTEKKSGWHSNRTTEPKKTKEEVSRYKQPMGCWKSHLAKPGARSETGKAILLKKKTAGRLYYEGQKIKKPKGMGKGTGGLDYIKSHQGRESEGGESYVPSR